MGWFGFDFDGTLATEIDLEPVPAMVNLLRTYLINGAEVRIVTARAGDLAGIANSVLHRFARLCSDFAGRVLPASGVHIQANLRGGRSRGGDKKWAIVETGKDRRASGGETARTLSQ